MSLIAPSTLVAIQSHASQLPPIRAKAPAATQQTTAPAAPRERSGGGVEIRLSAEAQAFLDPSNGSDGPGRHRVAAPSSDAPVTAPAGSTLDISV